MKKLEIKLRHFEELEATMDAERQAVSPESLFVGLLESGFQFTGWSVLIITSLYGHARYITQ